MNKKGFMFVETIMVMTILTTSLITIYITFSRVLINEKRRAMFDDTSYLYRTYLLEDYAFQPPEYHRVVGKHRVKAAADSVFQNIHSGVKGAQHPLYGGVFVRAAHKPVIVPI